MTVMYFGSDAVRGRVETQVVLIPRTPAESRDPADAAMAQAGTSARRLKPA
jgi:hypothetical protein